MTVPSGVERRVSQAERIALFLDYDGTLAELAPTPEHVDRNHEVSELLSELAQDERLEVAVVSGRRLSHVEQLLDVESILLAGTYGVELRTPDGERIHRVDYDQVRPVLEELKPSWAQLIADRKSFFLEDKGWALALHARFAEEQEAERVIDTARQLAEAIIDERSFRVLGGHKFLEVGPRLAHKGRTVEYLLARSPHAEALPVYLGDDDKDEEAFQVIQRRGGVAILVSAAPRASTADGRLASPRAARDWLRRVVLRDGAGESLALPST